MPFTLGKTLGLVLKRENNNYDLIRLIAAVTVIIFHALYLFKGEKDILTDALLINVWRASGTFAVNVFFFLSGIFITASFTKSKSSLAFVVMRVFRIWPALIVCICFTVFVVGLYVTTLSTQDYLKARGTWDYILHGLTLYHLRFELPGVFKYNLYPAAVNGSLWTLPMELCCYLMIYVLGVLGVLKRVLLAFLSYAIILAVYWNNFAHLNDIMGAPFPYFILGSCFYFLKNYIVVDYKVLAVAIAVCTIFYNPLLLNLVVLYAIMVIGASRWFKAIHLPGDYSYGIYIYGFLIQQVIAQFCPDVGRLQSIAVTLPFVLILAMLSWHFIEAPSITLGKKIASNSIKNLTSRFNF